MLGEELFGRKRYGHGRYHTTKLRIVPWFSTQSGERRDVQKGEPIDFDNIEDRDSRLEALGYK